MAPVEGAISLAASLRSLGFGMMMMMMVVAMMMMGWAVRLRARNRERNSGDGGQSESKFSHEYHSSAGVSLVPKRWRKHPRASNGYL
jgi:high-affinity Fe2+/Pb2+ permease